MPKPAPKSVSLVRGLRADDVVDRAIAYQHETSRCGDPHLHTRVIVPNRQARADGDNLGTRSDRLVPHHDRLQCGHQIAMAADALAAYKADTAAGKDALLRMRRAEYRRWQSQQWERQADLDRAIDQHRSRGRKQSTDYSLDLCALMPGGTW